MKRFGIEFGPVLRISVGFVSLTIALVLIFDSMFDVLPNERKQLLQVRQQVSRTVGNQVVAMLADGDIGRLQSVLKRLSANDPEILSVGVRRADGEVVAASPEHLRHWVPPEDGKATLTNIVMPIYVDKARWGDIEIEFKNSNATPLWTWLTSPGVILLGLFSTIGFVAFYLYLRRALQYLDPSQAVPERVRKAFDTLTESVVILDVKGRIMLANTSFQELHPLAIGQLDGKPITGLKWLIDSMPEEPNNPEYAWDMVVRSNQVVKSKHLKIALPDGKSRDVMMNCSAINDGIGVARGCLLSFNDITELSQTNALLEHTLQELQSSQDKIQQQNEELKKLAHFDPLTGCLNRRAFFSQAEALFQDALVNGKESVCIMTDIDHFKSFNDRYGHAVGDLVIQQVAKTLGRCIRSNDLLCRYGGEEFCIFLVEISLEAALEVGERMRYAMEMECGPGIRTVEGLRITSSFGVASIKTGVKSLADMIDLADQGLYKAKKNGRNQVTPMYRIEASESAQAH